MDNTNSNNSADKKGSIGFTTEISVPARLVALVAGAGESLVKKVRDGAVTSGAKAKRIAVADKLLHEGMSNLMHDVREQVMAKQG